MGDKMLSFMHTIRISKDVDAGGRAGDIISCPLKIKQAAKNLIYAFST